ncbi:MAG: hypothetical protein ACO3JL_04645, partial [Myxococcota bacterium]
AFLATLEGVAGRPLVTQLKPMVLGTCLPMVGGFVEALLYFRMAKLLKEHADAQDRSGLIVGLALVRPVLAVMGPFAFGLLAAVDGPFSFPWLVFGSFSLLSLSVLAVITQVLVGSLLAAVLPAAAHVELGGIGGAEGSVAVSTTNAGQPR